MGFVTRSLLVIALLTACQRRDPQQDAPSPPADPLYAALQPLPLVTLRARRAELEGRDDLDALDTRMALELAWRNRSPEQVGTDLSALSPELRTEERALRQTWRSQHVAYSWDNLDPDAQLDPRPADLSLTWLTLVYNLPQARNGWPFEEPWITDYFTRKRWYTPDPDDLRLSMVDRVQIDNARRELAALDAETLRAHLDSPLPGASPEQVLLERRLAQVLLEELAHDAP